MRLAPFEGGMDGGGKPLTFQSSLFHQEAHVYKVFDTAVGASGPGQSVGVEFLGKLFLGRNGGKGGGMNAREGQPVASL